MHNGQLANELFERIKRRVLEEADSAGPDAVYAHLQNVFNGERQTVVNEVKDLTVALFSLSKRYLSLFFTIFKTVRFSKNGRRRNFKCVP